MTRALGYMLVGYDRGTGDRGTGFAETSHEVPAARFAAVKQFAGIPADDPDAVGDWPLSDAAARRVASLLGKALDLERLEFCLEPYPPASHHASADLNRSSAA